MVAMLGPHDELLRTMDRQFPRVEINVRGNEFRLSGPTSEVALVERLIDELLIVIGAGHPLTGDAVERSIGMLRAPSVESPADVLTMNIVSNRGRTIRPKTLGSPPPAPARHILRWRRRSPRCRANRSTGSS